eukprot:jgi/Bigna1/81926/fgenesh1_pg.85_\
MATEGVDPYYESIDCPNEWCDLTKEDPNGDAVDLDKYWAKKGGMSEFEDLGLEGQVARMSLETFGHSIKNKKDYTATEKENKENIGQENKMRKYDKENNFSENDQDLVKVVTAATSVSEACKSKDMTSSSKKHLDSSPQISDIASTKKATSDLVPSSKKPMVAMAKGMENEQTSAIVPHNKDASKSVVKSKSFSNRKATVINKSAAVGKKTRSTHSKQRLLSKTPKAPKSRKPLFSRRGAGVAKSARKPSNRKKNIVGGSSRGRLPNRNSHRRSTVVAKSTLSSYRKVGMRGLVCMNENVTNLCYLKYDYDKEQRGSKKAAIPTSLEREMEEVKKLHQEAEKRRKLAKKFRKILVPKTEYTRRSTKPLTEPEEFSFVTASRLGYREPKVASVKKRKPKVGLKSAASGPTHPIPFNLETDRRTKMKDQKQPFVSMSCKVNNFFMEEKQDLPIKHTALNDGELTGPISPQLNTKQRGMRKPLSSIVSSEEREVEEMKNFKGFKARPLDPKILPYVVCISCALIFTSGGEYGVPRVEKRKPTSFKEFNLSSAAARTSTVRKSVVTAGDIAAAEPRRFKARPFNPKLFKKKNNIKEIIKKKAMPLTEPKSPDLKTNRLVHKYIKDSNPEAEITKQKAKGKISGRASMNQHPTITVPTEFNLHTEKRGAAHKEDEIARLQAQREEEKKRLIPVAAPMPKFKPVEGINTDSYMQKQREEVIKVTEPEPFNLMGEELSRKAKIALQKKLQREEEEKRQKAKFVAGEIKWDDDFFLFASRKPLTKPEPFMLATQVRERESNAVRNEYAKAREEAEERKKAEEAALKARQEAEDREWRIQCVHKAHPIKKSKPLIIRPSTKPLTQPKAPSLKTASRVKE